MAASTITLTLPLQAWHALQHLSENRHKNPETFAQEILLERINELIVQDKFWDDYPSEEEMEDLPYGG